MIYVLKENLTNQLISMNTTIIEDLGIQIEYKITSELGLIYENRYAQQIDAEIYSTDEDGEKDKVIGFMSGIKLLIQSLADTTFSTLDLFDVHEESSHFAKLYSQKTGDFKSKNFEGFLGSDLLILTRIEILSSFRGLGIGKFVIKDFILNFGSGCGLVALKPFPLQFESRLSSYRAIMGYDTMNKSKLKSKQNLINFYAEIGFKVDFNGLMTLSTEYRNELSNIDLDNLTTT